MNATARAVGQCERATKSFQRGAREVQSDAHTLPFCFCAEGGVPGALQVVIAETWPRVDHIDTQLSIVPRGSDFNSAS